MMPNSLSFFADENISTDLVDWIKAKGYQTSSVKEEDMCGATDINIFKNVLLSIQLS